MKKLLNKIYSVRFVLVGFILVTETYLVTIVLHTLFGKRIVPFLRVFYKYNSKLILLLQGTYPSIKGKAPEGTYIYCMNHQSQLDIVISLAYLPAGFVFVAKEELLKTPMIGGLIKRAGYLTINRANARRSSETLDKIKEELGKGNSVLVFPEGTRSLDGNIQKVKRGGLQVAFQTSTPIVPVVNDPVYKIFKKGAKGASYQKIQSVIGTPVTFDWNNTARDYSLESAAKIESIMKEMLASIR